MENESIIPAAEESDQLQQTSKTEKPSLAKYLPWTKSADRIIEILLALGLSKKQVTDVLMGKEVTIVGEIVNPDDNRPLLVSSATVSTNVDDGGATCVVLINGKTVGNYVREYYEREILLKKSAEKSELVMQLYEENLEMRRLLGGKARTYK